MNFSVLRALAVLGVSVVAACSMTGSQLPPAGLHQIGPGYAVGGGAWSNGTKVLVFYGLKPMPDGVALCGVWTVESETGTVSRFHRDILSTMSITVNGTTVAKDLNFLRRRPWSDGGWGGVPTSCVMTDLPASTSIENAELDVVVPRRRVQI
ncbi:MAG: hypothetical protein AAGI10_14300 [Pseudomonadota bacterium]